MKFSVVQFAGEKPAVANHLLPDNAASACSDTRMEGGSLVPNTQSVPNIYYQLDDVRSFRMDGEEMEADVLTDIDTMYQQAVDSGQIDSGSSWSFARTASEISSRRILTRTDHGSFVKAPLAGDLYNRWYSAGDADNPKLHYELDGVFMDRDMGAPDLSLNESNRVWSSRAETSLMSLVEYSDEGSILNSVVAEPAPEMAEEVYCAYYFTAVTDLGEEGVPSTPSLVFSRFDNIATTTATDSEYPYLPDYYSNWSSDNVYRFGAKINITITAAVYNDAKITKIRLYRAEGGEAGNFVADIEKTGFVVSSDGTEYTLAYIDDLPSASLGYECVSTDFNAPDSSMRQLTNVTPGVMAGYFDNTICFSYPYYPHAWPVEYQYTMSADDGQVEIRGVCMISGYVLITTNNRPVLMYGSDPSSMSQQTIDTVAPNLSERGLVDMGGFALYPSHEGLAMVSTSELSIITRDYFTKDQWKALKPETFVAFRYRDEYLCFYEGGAFSFNLEHGVFPISVDFTDSPMGYGFVQDGYYSAANDVFWLLVKSSANSENSAVVSFQYNPESRKTAMNWSSKTVTMPSNGVISCARVDADEAVKFRIASPDGGYDFEVTTVDDKGFRLPPGRPRRFYISLESEGRINAVTVASSMSELL